MIHRIWSRWGAIQDGPGASPDWQRLSTRHWAYLANAVFALGLLLSAGVVVLVVPNGGGHDLGWLLPWVLVIPATWFLWIGVAYATARARAHEEQSPALLTWDARPRTTTNRLLSLLIVGGGLLGVLAKVVKIWLLSRAG